jgi:hypothetical protein
MIEFGIDLGMANTVICAANQEIVPRSVTGAEEAARPGTTRGNWWVVHRPVSARCARRSTE